MEPELGAEIRHHVAVLEPCRLAAFQGFVVIGVIGRQHAIEIGQEDMVFGSLDQTLFIYTF